MSGGSGTGYPVMNRGPCCAQTGRSERKRGMGVGNKTILLFLGRRFFFSFFFFFLSAGAKCCWNSAASSHWSCIICSEPVSWEPRGPRGQGLSSVNFPS